MRRLIQLVLGLVALAAFAGSAAGQVAAPLLNPTALMITTENPAVLQWSTPSRITLGYFDGSNTNFNAAGVQTNVTDLSGGYVQARAVGESFAVGAERLQLDIKPQVGAAIDYVETQVAAAGQMGGMVALGVGQDKITQTPAGGVADSNTLGLGGASLRFWERIYLGAALGTESLDLSPTSSVSRDVMRAGIGFHMRGADSGLHLEVTRETRAAYTVEVPPGVSVDRDEETLDGAHVEFIVANILVGLASRQWKVRNPTAATGWDEDNKIVVLGWVPAQGLAVVLRHETRERTNTNNSTQDRVRDRVAIAWQF